MQVNVKVKVNDLQEEYQLDTAAQLTSTTFVISGGSKTTARYYI